MHSDRGMLFFSGQLKMMASVIVLVCMKNLIEVAHSSSKIGTEPTSSNNDTYNLKYKIHETLLECWCTRFWRSNTFEQ